MEAEKTSVERRFLGLPSLGGTLAIVNCLSIFGIFLLIRTRYFRPDGGESYLLWIMAFLSSPLALPFLLPSMGPPTANEIIGNCIAIGTNSFIWGYGIAWVWSKLFRRRRTPSADADQPTMT